MVQPNKYGDTAVLIASGTGYLECLQLLLQNQNENIDWNVQSSHDGNTVAMRVASYGYVDCLNMLSQIETINWNLKGSHGWTA